MDYASAWVGAEGGLKAVGISGFKREVSDGECNG